MPKRKNNIELGCVPPSDYEIENYDNFMEEYYSKWEDPEDPEERFESSEIVLDGPDNIEIIFDYPLSVEHKLLLKVPGKGMTRGKLVDTIVKEYRMIYKTEEETSEIKSGNIPGMLNRNSTDGKFGIWGHGIEDLCVHAMIKKGWKKDRGIYELEVGS